jgi:hypothetical protein
LSPGQSPPPVRIPIVPLELFAILTVDSLNDQMDAILYAPGAVPKQPAQERSASSRVNVSI